MLKPNFIAGYIVNRGKFQEPLYLLLKRTNTSYLPEIWQMVTGKVAKEESAGEAVLREISEETGLSCSEIYNVDVTIFYDQEKNQIAFSANFCGFVDSMKDVRLSEKEHDEYKWCTFSQALTLLAFPTQKETLRFIHQHFVLSTPNSVNRLKVTGTP